MRGKEGDGVNGRYQAEDHPRVCGEKSGVAIRTSAFTGLPPRMRGKEMEDVPARQRGGITPACAGKRHQAGNPHHAAEDHPRVCGEKTSSRQSTSCCRGSPPRVRGKERLLPEKHTSSGITPAYAGKSRSRRTTVRPLRDHPRVCGEKHLCSQLERPPPGSPPRVRGKAGL